MIDYTNYRLALKHLEVQIANFESSAQRPQLTELDREGIKESVIQRFETAYELSWKFVKRYLTEELGQVDTPNSPKPVFKLADQNNLLRGRIDEWLGYANARVATAHDYSGEKAEETLAVIPSFLEDAIGLYQTMTEATWE